MKAEIILRLILKKYSRDIIMSINFIGSGITYAEAAEECRRLSDG